MVMEKQPLDFTKMRSQLEGKRGRQYWRSLEELADTADFRELVRQEFPDGAENWHDKFSRRGFLRVMGASLALAGLTACAPPGQRDEKIIPYIEQPESIIPGGKPLYFATAFPFGGYAQGVLVESHEGRPTKVEGNPDHPDGNGTTNIFAQASVLSLYDPDRAQVLSRGGKVNAWDAFLGELKNVLAQSGSDGAGLRLLTQTITSPSLLAHIDAVLKKYPAAKWYQYQPVNRDNVFAGAELAFGEPVSPLYHFQKAKVVLSLDADFFEPGAGNLRYARDFMAGRQGVAFGETAMNRLYVVESTPTLAGGSADHRLSLKAGQIEAYARAVAAAVGVDVPQSNISDINGAWIAAVAKDLQANAGESIVIAGNHQPPVVHALAHAINDALGNNGSTVEYLQPAERQAGHQLEALQELVSDMTAGTVSALLIFGGNPVYDAPADLDFAGALSNVAFRVYHGLYANETATQSNWLVPARHYLESWGDARAFDGTVTMRQPLIAPLFEGASIYEMLDILQGNSGNTDHDIVKKYWQGGQMPDEFVAPWRTALHSGVMPDTASPVKTMAVDSAALANVPPVSTDSQSLEVNFRPDPSIWDGEWANSGWLQELPRPFTKLTWDNAALVSPATAETMGVVNGDVVSLELNGRKIEVPVWITPGHPQNSVTVHLGYGRTRAGSVGNGAGVNAYPLRATDSLWFADGVIATRLGRTVKLASVQDHWSMEGRNLARAGTLEEFVANPTFAQEMNSGELEHPMSLYPPVEYEGNKWGMTINLSACIGCNACTIACQAENNIAVVGKEQVLSGREMHWIRIDRYYEGDIDNPEIHLQPVGCQQCESAPCEPVCPVEATLHSHEGLNDMVYNRCVGTRYCANNCPYKVRRFNFLDYSNFEQSPLLSMRENPDVTVRSRGIMEKCSYCTQRISVARIDAKKEGRDVRDGEIITACQGACPTQAITFGDISDPNSAVVKLKASPLNYTLLEELNTRPRTTYLATVRNPNPELEGVA